MKGPSWQKEYSKEIKQSVEDTYDEDYYPYESDYESEYDSDYDENGFIKKDRISKVVKDGGVYIVSIHYLALLSHDFNNSITFTYRLRIHALFSRNLLEIKVYIWTTKAQTKKTYTMNGKTN